MLCPAPPLLLLVLAAGVPLLPASPSRDESPCQHLDETEQCSSLIQSTYNTRRVRYVPGAGSWAPRPGPPAEEAQQQLAEEAEGPQGKSLVGLHSRAAAAPAAPNTTAEAAAKAKRPLPPAAALGGEQSWNLHEAQSALVGVVGWFTAGNRTQLTLSMKGSSKSASMWAVVGVLIPVALICICCMERGPLGMGKKRLESALKGGLGSKAPGGNSGRAGLATRPASRDTSSSPTEAQTDRAQPERPKPEAFLCPGLVVPSGCECTLVVPRLTPRFQPGLSRTSMGQVTIDDVKGLAVLRAHFCLPTLDAGQEGASSSRSEATSADPKGRCLVLTSTTQEATVFASCTDVRSEPGPGGVALAIHTAAGRPFGTIRQCKGTGSAGDFEIVTDTGFRARLGASESGTIAIFDSQGRALAATEESTDKPGCRMVRIGPLADAGLLALAVLAADLAESARAVGPEASSRRTTPPSAATPQATD